MKQLPSRILFASFIFVLLLAGFLYLFGSINQDSLQKVQAPQSTPKPPALVLGTIKGLLQTGELSETIPDGIVWKTNSDKEIPLRGTTYSIDDAPRNTHEVMTKLLADNGYYPNLRNQRVSEEGASDPYAQYGFEAGSYYCIERLYASWRYFIACGTE